MTVAAELVVVCFAGLIASHTIQSLVGTQIEDVTGTSQDTETKDRRWNFATQWSLPKVETLRLFTPGLFGYLLAQNTISEDKSTGYWGLVGQDPRIPQLRSDDPAVRAQVVEQMKAFYPVTAEEQTALNSSDRTTRQNTAASIIKRFGFIKRHSGNGEYAGVLVALMAVFALANSCRGADTPFSPAERRIVWFWGGAALFSILAAWGRHGFLYALLYRLPYFSTIRNPIKFLQPFHIIWIILAGYGLEALHRRYMQNAVRRTAFLPEHIRAWWARAAGFEKKWVWGCALVLAASMAGCVVLLLSSESFLIPHFVDHGFGFKASLAPQMARNTVVEAGWFIGFLFLSAGMLAGILSGAWSGPLAKKAAWIYLGAILILDLGRTDLPWLHYLDYAKKYSDNPVVDFILADKKPWDQRVMGRLSPRRAGSNNGDRFGQLYNFWMQNDFPYSGIQSLDFAQMPRMPKMDDAYMHNFELHGIRTETTDMQPAARLWELTGTRYLFIDAAAVNLLNEQADPVRHGFHLVQRLHMEAKDPGQVSEDFGDFTVSRRADGEIGIIEYDHVLPRAKLFAHWETPADGPATLATLVSTNFNPAQTVLLWTNTPVAQAPGDPSADAGTVEITDYHPKDIQLRATAKLPAVLLLNERFASTWSVTVDQHPAPLLRCNYIMRGVFLPPGDHRVEFRYHTSLTTLWVSLGGWVAGLLVAGYVVWQAGSRKEK